MSRATVVFFSAVEAAITAAIGLGFAIAPLTISWAVQYHMNVPWVVFWRASGDAWLLGHGVDLSVAIDRDLGLSLGLPGSIPPFVVTVAALGIAFFTFAMCARVGRRAGEAGDTIAAVLAAGLTAGAIGLVVGVSSASAPAAPSLWQSLLLPAAVAGGGVAFGSALHAATASRGARVPAVGGWMPPHARSCLAASLRVGTGIAAALVAASAVLVAVLLLVGVGTQVSLYEGVQAGYLGGITLTLSQLALLPNAVIWAASWLAGPGFAVGTGTAVTATHVQLGTLPGVPLLGLISASAPSNPLVGVVALLVPVLLAFGVAYVNRRRAARSDGGVGAIELAAGAVGGALVGAVILGLLSWWSGGSLAPGVLSRLGPDPVAVGTALFVEFAVGAAAGVFAAHYRGAGARSTPSPGPRVGERVADAG